jgi:probable F420-dependent oxidoreductase
VALATVAAVTSKLRIGTGVCLVIERDPITLAKEVASLDSLSNGRFLFGIGGGWNEEEMENHGTDPKKRWRVLRERIEAMKKIWTEDEAEYHGQFVDFDPIWSWPKPAQKPYPPILIGGGGPHTLQRVVDYGDGWMPIAGRDDITGRISELNDLAQKAGRDPIPVTVFGVPARPEFIERYAEAGVDRCILGLRPEPADEALPRLKHYAEVTRGLAAATA